MSGSRLVALSDVQEALPNVWEWSGYSPGCPGVVGRLSEMSRVVGRPSQMSRRGQEAFPFFWEWSGDSLGCPGVFGRPYRMSVSV